MIANSESEHLSKYFEMIKNNPSLALPKDAPIRIITDIIIIREWQEKNATKDNVQIGFLLQDRYITIVRDLVEFPDGSINGYNRIIGKRSVVERDKTYLD